MRRTKNNIREVFQHLGIKPNEPFNVSFSGIRNKSLYVIDGLLEVYRYDPEEDEKSESTFTIFDFLDGQAEVVKIDGGEKE